MQSLAQILGPVNDPEGAWERLGQQNQKIRELRDFARGIARLHLSPLEARQALRLVSAKIEELARNAIE